MARPRSFDEKTVLDCLTRLFWEQGYRSTTYAQAVAASGLREPSLYGAFGNKQALFSKCLVHYLENYASQADVSSQRQNAPLKQLHAFCTSFIESLVSPNTPAGCFYTNSVAEARGMEAPLQNMIADVRNQLEEKIGNWLKEAKKLKQLKPNIHTTNTASLILSQLIGMGITAQFNTTLVAPAAKACLKGIDDLEQQSVSKP